MKGLCSSAMTRRSVVLALSATTFAPALMAQARAPIVTRRLNNVMLAVSDLNRSITFYEKMFGPAVRQDGVAIFRVGGGPHFFGLTSVSGSAKPGYVSYGLTVQDFNTETVMRRLTEFGVSSAQLTRRGSTREIFLTDPNGIKLQLQHTAYGHGSGEFGDQLPPVPPRATASVFQARTINHVTLTLKDGPSERTFYQRMFGMPLRAMQGPNTVTLGIGEGTDGIAFNAMANNPNAETGINHLCFTIENFDPARVMQTLIDNGFEPIETGIPALDKPLTCRVRWRQRANNGGGETSPLGSPELYFTDPDNIPIQIQDVSYCGGSGSQGQICP